MTITNLLLAIVSGSFYSSVGFASSSSEHKSLVTFDEKSSSTLNYQIQYPNVAFDVVIQGRLRPNYLERDCIAIVSTSISIEQDKLLRLSKTLSITEGTSLQNTLVSEFKNGTVVYYMPGTSLTHQTRLRIQTLNNKSFYENKQQILGEQAGINLNLEYRKGCRGVL